MDGSRTAKRRMTIFVDFPVGKNKGEKDETTRNNYRGNKSAA
jgi:hypothetical protein